MEIPEVIICAALLAGAIGMIGGQVMIWLIEKTKHPPDENRKKEKGGKSDGRTY